MSVVYKQSTYSQDFTVVLLEVPLGGTLTTLNICNSFPVTI